MIFLLLLLIMIPTITLSGETQTIVPLPELDVNFAPATRDFLKNASAKRHEKVFMSGFMSSGSAAPNSASLSHTIGEYEAFVHGYYVNQTPVSVTYTPNRRTYIFVDSVDGRSPELTASGGSGCTFKDRVGAPTTNTIRIECNAGSTAPALSIPDIVEYFYVDSSGTALAVNTIAPVGGVETQLGIFSVTTVGARPDDGIDDFQAFQTAIGITCARGGGAIFVPRGNYTVSDTVFINNCTGVTLFGFPQAGGIIAFRETIITQTDPTKDVVQINGSTNVNIENIKLAYSSPAVANTSALHIVNSTEVDAINVGMFSTNAYTCITVNTTPEALVPSFFVRIIRSELLACQWAGLQAFGAGIDKWVSIELSGSRIWGNGVYGIEATDWVETIYVNDTEFWDNGEVNIAVDASVADGRTKHIYIGPRAIVDGSRSQTNIFLRNVTRAQIRDSWISYCAFCPPGQGGVFGSGSGNTQWVVTNNTFYTTNNGGVGLSFEGTDSTIKGNTFYRLLGATGVIGINLGPTASNNDVTGNSFFGHTTAVVNNGTNNVVCNNFQDDIPGFHTCTTPMLFGSGMTVTAVPLATLLGMTGNNTLMLCSDCQNNTSWAACASGGSGALAYRRAGSWLCQ